MRAFLPLPAALGCAPWRNTEAACLEAPIEAAAVQSHHRSLWFSAIKALFQPWLGCDAWLGLNGQGDELEVHRWEDRVGHLLIVRCSRRT